MAMHGVQEMGKKTTWILPNVTTYNTNFADMEHV
jgi:hypothetical protein